MFEFKQSENLIDPIIENKKDAHIEKILHKINEIKHFCLSVGYNINNFSITHVTFYIKNELLEKVYFRKCDEEFELENVKPLYNNYFGSINSGLATYSIVYTLKK